MAFTAKSIVLFAIAMVIMSVVIPLAVSNVNSANQTGWSSSQKALWGVIGIVVIGSVVVGAAIHFIGGRRG